VYALLAAGCWLATTSPAIAADEIGLSNDGSHWSTVLTDPLFDPSFIWVPGDAKTSSFFVRNQGPTPAELTITVTSGDGDQLLANDDITLAARADGGSWAPLRNGVATTALTAQAIARGGSTRVELRARFDPASANRTEDKSLPLRFVVRLTEAIPTPGPTPSDSDSDESNHAREGGIGLPGTGSNLGVGTAWSAVALLGGGSLLALLARRRSKAAQITDR
jgi:hypothetical protein